MAFHEVRFPDNISRGARGGPERLLKTLREKNAAGVSDPIKKS